MGFQYDLMIIQKLFTFYYMHLLFAKNGSKHKSWTTLYMSTVF